jgi:uncharacterized membrane protein YczE
MKQRLTNWITTIIGAILMLTAVGMYVYSNINPQVDFHIMEMVLVAILGWVFLTARDTLLEGVFLNFFKMKKDGDNS